MVKRFIVQLHGREPPPHEATEGDAASGKSNYMDTEAALLEEKLVDVSGGALSLDPTAPSAMGSADTIHRSS